MLYRVTAVVTNRNVKEFFLRNTTSAAFLAVGVGIASAIGLGTWYTTVKNDSVPLK